MATRYSLIVIGTYKDSWGKLSRSKQSEFVSLVAQSAQEANVVPVNGYALTSTPGAFIEIWEGTSRAATERMKKNLEEMGYARYVDARFLSGERVAEEVAPQRAKRVEQRA